LKTKKFFSLVLALILVFSSISGSFASSYESDMAKENLSLSDLLDNKSLSDDIRIKSLKNSDQVRIIVELEDKPVIEYATQKGVSFNELDANTVKVVTDKLLDTQNLVKQEIKSSGINLEYHGNFVNVVNGFSASTTLEEAKKIEKLPYVKKVSIANEYDRPTPDMNTSGSMVSAPQTWALDYTGQGEVVAIIDTGIDPSHKDMVLSDASKAKYPDKASIDLVIDSEGLPGEWRTVKVPYGYNYMDNNQQILDLGPEASMHGMHVAGTVGANGDVENGGIKGIAPEAQLLAMKVFGNDPSMPSTFGDIIIRAIDDAIALGADVMNLSLGSTASFVQPDDPEQMAVTRAVENGIVMSISAGNSDKFGSGHGDPLNSNPDIGVVGSPGLTSESIQVASVENTHMKVDALEYDGDLIGFIPAGGGDPADVFSGAVEYIYCGLGGVEATYTAEGMPAKNDFAGKDLEGKIALIQRGAFAFTDKIMNAQNNGASGVIVFNDKARGDAFVSMQYPSDGTIPALFIGHSDAMTMLKQIDGEPIDPNEIEGLVEKDNNLIVFPGLRTIGPNPNGGIMSDFTSWGVTPSLDFKPEITAPGGQIYSTFNNDQYGLMSGTSMAAPHVSGGSALIAERVEKDFPYLSGKDKVEMVKNLLMATARPHTASGLINDYFALGNYTSPRRQGAGVMDLQAAATTEVLVTDKDSGLAKVNLQEIGNYPEFTLTLENFGDETVTYAVYGSVQTTLSEPYYGYGFEEQAIYDLDTLETPISFDAAKTVFDEVYNTITVDPGMEIDMTVSLDLSNAGDWWTEEKLSDVFENGTFVEGFVRFVDVTDSVPALSIPYVGFYGDWDEAPIIDGDLYGLYEPSFYEFTVMMDEETYFLGQTGENTFEADKVAFSPNGDGSRDQVQPLLSFLRNARKVEMNILDSDQNKLRTIYKGEYLRKNYHDSRYAKYTYDPIWLWDGTVNNSVVPEGNYYYEIKTVIDYPGASWQTIKFPVIVDNTAPLFDKFVYDKNENILEIEVSDNGVGLSDILLIEVLDDGNYEVVMDKNDLVDNKFDLNKLSAGPHVLLVGAIDYANNETIYDEVIISGDNTIPYFDPDSDNLYTSPEAFGVYNYHDIVVKGRIKDASGIVSLTVNGQPISYEYNEEVGAYEYYGVMSFETEGAHVLDYVAKDVAGNEINFERTIYIDSTAPSIDMTSEPVDRIVDFTVEEVELSGMITDNFTDLKVYINGNMEANIEKDYVSYPEELENPVSYEIASYVVPLAYGDNLITIKAIDVAGNTTLKEYKVYRKMDGEEDPVFADTLEMNTSIENSIDVSSDRPVTIKANANMDVEWTVTITNPEGVIEETFTQEGSEFLASWAPNKHIKLDGEYLVNIKATNEEQTVEEQAKFTVYNYPLKINDVNVIENESYIAIEASIENIGPNEENPMLIIQVVDEDGYVVNISTVSMEGLQDGQTIKLSSGFGVKEAGVYSVDVYVWTGWSGTESLSSPESTTFVVE